MITIRHLKIVVLVFLAGVILTTPLLTFAQDSTVNRLGITYQTMVDIPGVADETTGEVTVASYLNILYAIAVVAAALMAVVRIVLAGAKYMLSDVVTTKGQAINDIQSGIIGLLIIICAVLILGTINPDLGDIRFVENVRPVGDVHNVGGSTQAGTTISPLYSVGENGEQTVANYVDLSDEEKDLVSTQCQAAEGSFVTNGDGTAECQGILTIVPAVNTITDYYAINNSSIDQSVWAPELREPMEGHYIHNVANHEPETVTVGLAGSIDDESSIIWQSIEEKYPGIYNTDDHQIVFIIDSVANEAGETNAEWMGMQTQQRNYCDSERFNGDLLENIAIPGETYVSWVCITSRD